jgi:hypothetical protein
MFFEAAEILRPKPSLLGEEPSLQETKRTTTPPCPGEEGRENHLPSRLRSHVRLTYSSPRNFSAMKKISLTRAAATQLKAENSRLKAKTRVRDVF